MDKLKIKSLKSLQNIISRCKSENSKVGLICGCFDILHIGHMHLFEFAKNKVDVLVVGLDHDEAIRKTKGKNRPIHEQAARMGMLSYISLVDYVFPLDFNGEFGNNDSYVYWVNILKAVNPDAVITSTLADQYADSKREMASEMNIDFFPFKEKIDISSTTIEKIYMDGF